MRRAITLIAAGILVLATYDVGGVVFGGPLPWGMGHGTNVAIFRVSETSQVNGAIFAIPGDQRAVAFAHGAPRACAKGRAHCHALPGHVKRRPCPIPIPAP